MAARRHGLRQTCPVTTTDQGSERRPASDVTLFGHWICPYSVRVSFALAERGITHDVVDVPPTAVRPAEYVVPTEFVEHSPLGEIPLVRVDHEYRADSLPILEWLEERVDARPLLPSEPVARARVRESMAWIDSHVFPPMIGIYYGTDPERIATSADGLAAALTDLGEQLGDGSWLVGSGPTLAEAAVVPLYVRLEGLARLGFDRTVDGRVIAHRERVAALPGGRAVAWSSAQTAELVDRSERYRARRRRRSGSAPDAR